MLTSLQKTFGLLTLLLAGSASAQTFYEPVTYQYQYHGQTFYYAGHDPHVFGYVAHDIDRTTYSNAVTHPIHVMHWQRVYSDTFPHENLAENSETCYRGMTPADAENEANQNAPRYFSMRDVMRSSVMHEDGSVTVSADATCPVEHPAMPNNSIDPNVPRGTILIIPKKLLQPPASAPAPSVTMAK